MMKACLKEQPAPRNIPVRSIKRSIVAAKDTSSLSKVRRFVTSMASKCGFDKDQAFEIAIAVNEACANAILHSDAEGFIEVRVSCRRSFMVTVVGTGSFRDAKTRQKYSSQSGRGLGLMSALMDRVTISIGGGITKVTMTKYLREQHQP